MKKVLGKSKNLPNLVGSNRHKKPASLLREPDAREKIRKAIENHAERARVSRFIQLGHLPDIFVYEKGYSDTLLNRLWEHYECDRVPEARRSKTKYETWFWLFHRWAGIPDDLWRGCGPITHLPLYDRETKAPKKERYGGRSDLDIVMLEDLKEYIENISKGLSIDFPLPSLLFPVTPQVANISSFKHSEDFRSVSYSGKRYTLTSRQAQVIQILFEAWEKKTPDVGNDFILEELGSPSSRLRDTFKSNRSAWKDLVSSNRKGTVRLNIS